MTVTQTAKDIKVDDEQQAGRRPPSRRTHGGGVRGGRGWNGPGIWRRRRHRTTIHAGWQGNDLEMSGPNGQNPCEIQGQVKTAEKQRSSNHGRFHARWRSTVNTKESLVAGGGRQDLTVVDEQANARAGQIPRHWFSLPKMAKRRLRLHKKPKAALIGRFFLPFLILKLKFLDYLLHILRAQLEVLGL